MEILRAIAAHFDDYRVLLLFYWVEAYFIVYAGSGLLGIRIGFRNNIKIGLLQGLAVFLVRGIYNLLHFPLGTHVLVLVIILSFFIARVRSLRWGIALTAALLGTVLQILGEPLILPNLHKMLNMPIGEMWRNPWTHVLAGYAGDVLLILVALFVAVTNVCLVRATEY